MTSNLGAASSETLKIGFGDQVKSKEIEKAVEKFFTPEFRNRLDGVVKFNKLDPDLMLMIVDRLVKETNELLNENETGIKLLVTDVAKKQLSEKGYQPSMGARPLKRVFEEQIKKPLSKKILFEDLKNITITMSSYWVRRAKEQVEKTTVLGLNYNGFTVTPSNKEYYSEYMYKIEVYGNSIKYDIDLHNEIDKWLNDSWYFGVRSQWTNKNRLLFFKNIDQDSNKSDGLFLFAFLFTQIPIK